MSAPRELQTAALLGHVASQMQLDVAFLESQNYLSPQDAATMKEIIGRLPVPNQASLAAATHVRVVERAVPPPPRQPPAGVYARAVWGYNENGAEANDLSFAAGETIEIVSEKNADWWLGRARGKEGLFPSNHVEKMESAGRVYQPFAAAPVAPPPSGAGFNAVGPQQAEERKNKLGPLGNTLAHSAVGGIGFGAGAAMVNAIF